MDEARVWRLVHRDSLTASARRRPPGQFTRHVSVPFNSVFAQIRYPMAFREC
jgi:hypothetical protein